MTIFIDAEHDPERTIFKNRTKHPVLAETWRGDASLRPEPAHTRVAAVVVRRPVRRPRMMLFCPVEESDQGSRINDGATH